MKKVSRENLDALFAAIAEAKKLYLPVADGTDDKRSAKYSVWTPKAKYAVGGCQHCPQRKGLFLPAGRKHGRLQGQRQEDRSR